MIDLDLPDSDDFDACIQVRKIYQSSRCIPYLSQQLFLEDDAVLQDFPLSGLVPKIVAWTTEEVKDDGELATHFDNVINTCDST